jgi:hypothetical protein
MQTLKGVDAEESVKTYNGILMNCGPRTAELTACSINQASLGGNLTAKAFRLARNHAFCVSFAHESLKGIVRLKIKHSGRLSLSRAK